MVHRWYSPAREMSQPVEKLNQMSTHNSSLKETVGQIVNGIDNVILFGLKCRVAVEDRQNRRCRGTTKMLFPSRGTDEQVTSLNDSFPHLRLVEPLDCAFTEPLIGSPTQPTPSKEMKRFLSFEGVSRRKKGRGAHVSP